MQECPCANLNFGMYEFITFKYTIESIGFSNESKPKCLIFYEKKKIEETL